MAEKDSDRLPEREADERFNRLVGNLVRTPHKPHLSETATEALRRIRDERFDELHEFGAVIERLKADGLVLDAPSGLVLSERAYAWLGGDAPSA